MEEELYWEKDDEHDENITEEYNYIDNNDLYLYVKQDLRNLYVVEPIRYIYIYIYIIYIYIYGIIYLKRNH